MAQAVAQAAGLWLLFRSGDAARAAANHNNRRLVEAAAARGIRALIVDPARIVVLTGRAAGPVFALDGLPVEPPAAAILRTGARLGRHGVAVAAALARAGVAGLAPGAGIEAAVDKLLTARLCAEAGLPAPRTVGIGGEADLAALGATLGWPCILKARRGSKGREVRLCPDLAAARRALAELAGAGPLVAQCFVAASCGRDLRILIVGGEVAGAIARQAPPGEFRSNVALGGSARPVTPDPGSAALAQRAARAAGLAIAGVDILHGAEGPLLCEINAAPGFEALERAGGADIAGRIIDHLAAAAAGRAAPAAA